MNNELIKNIFIIIGLITTLLIALMFLYYGITELKELIIRAHWKYEYKHRFDKPPTAKCYCNDCELHNKNNKCNLPGSDRYTPPTGFCYEASPIKKGGNN